MAKCCECKEEIEVVFEGRFCGDNCKLFIVKENYKEPTPTGYCKECFKKVICKDIDYMEDQFNGK